MRIRRVLRAILCSLPLCALAQSTPQQKGDDVPEHVIYRFFLKGVADRNEDAKRAEAQGLVRDAAQLRAYDQRHALLTDAEAESLRRIADEFVQQQKSVDEALRAAIEQERASYNATTKPGREAKPFAFSDRLMTQYHDRDHLVDSYVDQLRNLFGADDFQKFDKYVHWTMRTIQVSKPDQSTTGTRFMTRGGTR